MKIIISIVLTFIFQASFGQQSKIWEDSITKKYKYIFPTNISGYYFVRNKKEKAGMIDSIGNEIIKPIFEYINSFENGKAESGNMFNKEIKRGLIDFSGKIVVPFMYDYIYKSGNANYVVELNNKRGVINNTNKILIPIKYEYITDANENKFIVKENNKFGFMGEDGKTITKNIYKGVERFYDNKAAVILENNSGTVINTAGEEMFKPIKNIRFLDIKNELLEVYNLTTNKYGVFNEKGKEIIPIMYDEIELYENNVRVKKNNKYGLLDKENNIKIPIEYDYINSRLNVQFICNKNKLECVLDANNVTIIPKKFIKIDLVYEKYYFVETIDSLCGVIDIKGNEIIPSQYKFYNNCNGKIFASKNNNYLIIDLENTANKISLDVEGMKKGNSGWSYEKGCTQIALKNGKYGIINTENKIIIPFEYEDIRSTYGYKRYIVKQNGKYGIIDSNNKILKEIIYDNIIQQKETLIFYKDGKRVNGVGE